MCDYYDKVLEGHLLPSGQVRFFGMHDYRGNSSSVHHLTSTLSGKITTVKVRRKLVDTTYVEASRDDLEEKNRLCPPLSLTGEVSRDVGSVSLALKAPALRMAEPDIAAWNENSRLNPQRGLADHLDDPRIQEAFARVGTNMERALANLERMAAETQTPAMA